MFSREMFLKLAVKKIKWFCREQSLLFVLFKLKILTSKYVKNKAKTTSETNKKNLWKMFLHSPKKCLRNDIGFGHWIWSLFQSWICRIHVCFFAITQFDDSLSQLFWKESLTTKYKPNWLRLELAGKSLSPYVTLCNCKVRCEKIRLALLDNKGWPG